MYAGRCLMMFATLMFLTVFLIEIAIPRNEYLVVATSGFSMVSLIATVAMTEQRLSRLFFKDGKRRPNRF
jgi:hypothetical protein